MGRHTHVGEHRPEEKREKYMSVLAIDIQISEPINNAIDKFLGFIPSLLVFLVVLVVGLFIAKMIRKAVSALLQKINFDSYLDKAGIGGPLSLIKLA